MDATSHNKMETKLTLARTTINSRVIFSLLKVLSTDGQSKNLQTLHKYTFAIAFKECVLNGIENTDTLKYHQYNGLMCFSLLKYSFSVTFNEVLLQEFFSITEKYL